MFAKILDFLQRGCQRHLDHIYFESSFIFQFISKFSYSTLDPVKNKKNNEKYFM